MADDPRSRNGWSASVGARMTIGGPPRPAGPLAAPAQNPVQPDLRQWLAQAVRHHQQNRFAEAEQLYRQILGRDPYHADALDLLGVIANTFGAFQDAAQMIARAITVDGRVPRYHMDLAVALKGLGRLEEAEASCRRAIELQPNEGGFYSNLGTILQDMGKAEEALPIYRRAIELNPGMPEAHLNLGAALQDLERYEEAAEATKAALKLNPESGDAHANLALGYHALGRLDEARPLYDRAIKLKPQHAETSSNRLMCLTYMADISPEALLSEHREWDRRHAVRIPPRAYANSREPERRLRIGYVSADLRTHPVGYFMLDVLKAHSEAVETFLYSHTPVLDEVSERLRGAAGHWRNLIGVQDDKAAEMILNDGVDILVDVSGHTANNRLLLFTHRPAPVQASWLGHPSTTGLSAIDYLIMDEAAVPAGAERWCSEAVARLPHGRFCYAPPAYAPPVAEPPPGRPVTFGSFNNMTKLTPQVVRLWAEVLKANPGSRLILKWKSLTEPGTQGRLERAFGEAGVEPGRVEFRNKSPHVDMLAEYGDIDIALDPFPFCGGLTSCEALWMGVPVVTLPGKRPASRQTLGFLQTLGLGELAASSEADYVRIASQLAAHPDWRAVLRRDLRPRMAGSPLCDGALFTASLEDAFRRMWRGWCAGEPAKSF
jgi:predicted O-linked N-acetylglucosamine transferase (SPINDLY family)